MSDDGGRSAGRGHGHEGRGLGGAVSEAATTAAHTSKQDLDDAGFRNRGEAVSTAVHDAQQDARESEEPGETNGTPTTGTPTASTGMTTHSTRP
jgi:hypothetical protein